MKHHYGCPTWIRTGEGLAPCPKPLVEGGQHCKDHASKKDYR